jgi:BirA family transcriptional regulator, biotin operon repressor / biotin---[acetyl-CoA-carboxylase] ligase
MIEAQELQSGLNCHRFGRKVYSFQTIDSTNTFARSLAARGEEEGALVIAEEQTAGRGRQGRTWSSNIDENLTFTLLLRPEIPNGKINLLPLGIAVALTQGIRRLTSLPVLCKWPNDLLLMGGKVAGILMESALSSRGFEYVVVGIGINVNQRKFPEHLRTRATSLALHAGHAIDRVALLRSVLQSIESNYETYTSGGLDAIVPSWLSLAPMVGKQITAAMQGTTVAGTVLGLSADGGLQLRTDAGDLTLFAGDVTILDMESYAPRN